MLVFDIESDGLLDTISKVHCINLIDRRTGREYRYTDNEFYFDVDGDVTNVKCPRDGTISDGLIALTDADEVAGVNVIGYDIPALKIVYPKWTYNGMVRDQVVESKLLYPDLKDRDFAALRKGRLPFTFQKEGLIGRNSLKAWAIRIGRQLKGDFNPKDYGHTWATMPFTQDFDEYCMDDVRANVVLIEHFESKPFFKIGAVQVENRVGSLINDQVLNGIHFDEAGGEALMAKLAPRRAELETECQMVFTPWYAPDGPYADHGECGNRGLVASKKTRKVFIEDDLGTTERTVTRKVDGENVKVKQVGYYQHFTEGLPHTKIKQIVFNPGSRDQIADRLINLYGWKPVELTDGGKPKVDETVLGGLPYPEAKKLSEFFTVNKRISQLAEGKEAWMKKSKDGKIHGRVDTLGAITNRMTHMGPNLAQVPANHAPYGEECRALFGPRPGWKQVGMDADGLEGRCLSHYLYRYDGGAYVKIILEGNKADGTDLHSLNRKAVGITTRDGAKTVFYAWMYGGGDYKLGIIYVDDMTEEQRDKFYEAFPAGKKRDAAIVRLGRRTRSRLVAGIKGMDPLLKGVKARAKAGWIKAIDGRRLRLRSAHSALNTLLQGMGAIVMKYALCIAAEDLLAKYKLDVDFHWLLNVHDEIQVECRPEIAEDVGQILAAAVATAGAQLDCNCPMEGSFDIGANWSETH